MVPTNMLSLRGPSLILIGWNSKMAFSHLCQLKAFGHQENTKLAWIKRTMRSSPCSLCFEFLAMETEPSTKSHQLLRKSFLQIQLPWNEWHFSTKEGFFVPIFHCFGLFIAYVPLLKLGTFWVLGLMALYMLSQCCWLAHLSVTKAIPPHVTRTNHSGNSRLVTHSVTRTSLTMPALIEGYWRMPQSSNTVCSLRFSQCHSEKPHLLLKLSSRYCWNIWKNIFFPPKKVLLA